MQRHLARTVLCLTMASMTFLAACGSSNGQNTALAANQVMTVMNVGVSDVKSLDPALIYDLNSADALQMIYSGLVGFDPTTLNLVPDMAQELPTTSNGGITNGGKTYTFHIRQNAKFSDGTPVTAQDVAFSIDRGFAPCLKAVPPPSYMYMLNGATARNNGKLASIIGPGKGIVVVDDHTIQFNIASPDAFFLAALTYNSNDVLDPSQVPDSHNAAMCADETWTNQPIGTGPFMLKEHDQGSKMIFVPNPYWYGQPTKLTQVTMTFIPKIEPAYQAYKQNKADVDGYGGTTVTSADANDARSLPNGQYKEGQFLSINYLQGNANIAPFNNKTVRVAFAEATDRASIAHDIWKDTVIASGHIVPQGMLGYNPNLQVIPFNPTQAKTDLQSVYRNVSAMPPVTLLYDSDSEEATATAERLQGDYQLYLGVHINIKGEPFLTEINDIFTNNIQFYLTAWIADYPDAQDWLSLQLEKGDLYNTGNYSNPQFDALCQKADIEQDPTMRNQDYNQAEQIAVSDAAWDPINQQKNIYLQEPWVHGFTIDGGGLTPDTVWANVYITQH